MATIVTTWEMRTPTKFCARERLEAVWGLITNERVFPARFRSSVCEKPVACPARLSRFRDDTGFELPDKEGLPVAKWSCRGGQAKMGLIKAAFGAAGGVVADQWLEYFYCEAMPETTLAVKGRKRINAGGQNVAGTDNIISNGSKIAVADGQCMIIVNQGRILDVCAEPGEYRLELRSEPSLFAGGAFADNALDALKNVWERLKFGGQPGMDTRVYYFNTKELIGNKYGTPNPVPFRVVDRNIGLDMDISVRFFGQYSYRISNPILFYRNVAGNFADTYTRGQIDAQLKTELLDVLQPAIARISAMGIRYSALPGHTAELAEALNEVLSPKWRDLRGLEIASFGVASVNASPEDEQMIKDLQRTAVMRDPTMAAAMMVGAQATALQAAASNDSGAMSGFFGLGMAQGAVGVMNPNSLYAMGQPQPPQGSSDMAPAQSTPSGPGWTCTCGVTNSGKFCQNCGTPKPAGMPQYRCDKCGWVPPDPTTAPKFCPECGDPFDDGDLV